MDRFFKKVVSFFLFSIIFIYNLSSTSMSANLSKKIGVGIGYPYFSIKYNFSSKIASEIRYATGEGINVYAGRFYWNFFQLRKLNAFTGIEGGYIDFDTLDTEGTGYEGSIFIGGEYFINPKFSFGLDIGPVYISVDTAELGKEFNVGGIEWVSNLCLNYYFDFRKKPTSRH